MLPDVHHVIALYYLLTYCSFDTRQVWFLGGNIEGSSAYYDMLP